MDITTSFSTISLTKMIVAQTFSIGLPNTAYLTAFKGAVKNLFYLFR